MALMDRIEDSEDHAEDFALACVRVNASLARMAESVDGSTPLGTALNSAAVPKGAETETPRKPETWRHYRENHTNAEGCRTGALT